MKSWFIFGFGLFLGMVFGAFLASFLLFDDVTQDHSKATVAMAGRGHHPRAVAPVRPMPALVAEERPASVIAQPVNLESLPPADDPSVISTVKRDESAPDLTIH